MSGRAGAAPSTGGGSLPPQQQHFLPQQQPLQGGGSGSSGGDLRHGPFHGMAGGGAGGAGGDDKDAVIAELRETVEVSGGAAPQACGGNGHGGFVHRFAPFVAADFGHEGEEAGAIGAAEGLAHSNPNCAAAKSTIRHANGVSSMQPMHQREPTHAKDNTLMERMEKDKQIINW